MKTNAGRNINVKSNKSNRTFTIRVDGNKYRTYPMSQEEFNNNEYNTANDWNQFLKSDDYYRV